MLDLSVLNPAQAEAVLTTEGPLLVLAGAGSGKTRVLTYRIAHLVQDLGVAPWSILAVTFTNKAAKEMRTRLSGILAGDVRGMWINTFHSMCVRMLRADAQLLGYGKDFTIYDADDSKRLVKDIMAELGYDTKRFPDAGVRSRISAAKNDLKLPSDMPSADPYSKCVAAVYKALQARLKRSNAMDFDDLLLNTYLLLRDNPQIATAYGQRFRYILVDEYQDTNRAQYAITKMLAQVCGNLMVVGDDDQSIYSWRGADIRNILDFERDWPAAKTVKLEQNYRSTGNILAAANAVIANNASRKSKKLFTQSPAGEQIGLYLAADERDEGRWIASRIEQLHDGGTSYNDIALFYRTNAQSRTLEDMLLRAGVPYQIVGGTRFFDRMEIRDCMAYLKLTVNPADDVSALRVVNTPRRGIGKTTVERIQGTARVRGISFFEAAREESLDPACRASTRKALESFVKVIDEARSYAGPLDKVVEMIIERSGLIPALQAMRTEEADARVENIKEFVSVVQEYVESHPLVEDEALLPAEGVLELNGQEFSAHPPTLADFMEWLSLRTDLDSVEESEEKVTLMTIHSAKGLEFDVVFVSGMEETIFPHSNSMIERGVEEERRLAYVAITRARKQLFLTHAQTRRLFGQPQANPRSRFVSEIPKELIHSEGIGSLGLSGTGWEKRGDRHSTYGSGRGEEMYGGRVFGRGNSSSSLSSKAEPRRDVPELGELKPGDVVDHKTFGRGTVLAVEGDKLTIRFAKSGQTKKLLKGYAPLVKIQE
ncbi:MAG: ATP-dependent helicase [Coriobacteriales bacterium]